MVCSQPLWVSNSQEEKRERIWCKAQRRIKGLIYRKRKPLDFLHGAMWDKKSFHKLKPFFSLSLSLNSSTPMGYPWIDFRRSMVKPVGPWCSVPDSTFDPFSGSDEHFISKSIFGNFSSFYISEQF
jgi:hypothetical protein